MQIGVFGNSGIGKTTFIGTALNDERSAPVLLLDVDRSTMSIDSKCREISIAELGKPEPDKIDVLRVDSWNDFQAVYDFLFSVKSKDARAAYNTVAIDTLTEVHYVCLQFVAGMDKSPRLDPSMPEIQDYGKASTIMKKLLRAFRDIEGVNMIYTFQPRLLQGNQDSIAQIKPHLIGQLADEAPALIPIIGYMQVTGQENKREMLFQPTTRIMAKDRTEGGKLGSKIENPTMTKVLDLLEGKSEPIRGQTQQGLKRAF
jgi:hypothetical protein